MNGSVNGQRADLVTALEAVLFVAEEPVELTELARALEVSVAAVRGLVDRLAEQCTARGLRVQRQGTRVQLVTAPEVGAYVSRFLGARAEQRLSPAALETLAIIAYRQPITRPALEAIRGVNCDHAIATLRARGLIDEVGRAESVGRPVLFGTTIAFLQHFGLTTPEELPPLPAVADEAQAKEGRAS
jgi:segregation and condensation protein B